MAKIESILGGMSKFEYDPRESVDLEGQNSNMKLLPQEQFLEKHRKRNAVMQQNKQSRQDKSTTMKCIPEQAQIRIMELLLLAKKGSEEIEEAMVLYDQRLVDDEETSYSIPKAKTIVKNKKNYGIMKGKDHSYRCLLRAFYDKASKSTTYKIYSSPELIYEVMRYGCENEAEVDSATTLKGWMKKYIYCSIADAVACATCPDPNTKSTKRAAAQERERAT